MLLQRLNIDGAELRLIGLNSSLRSSRIRPLRFFW